MKMKKKILTKSSDKQSIKRTEDNFIKNLKYEVRLNKNNYYKITSEESEINYINNEEIVKNVQGESPSFGPK